MSGRILSGDDSERGSGQPAPHETQQGADTPGHRASEAAGNVADPHLTPIGHRGAGLSSPVFLTADSITDEQIRELFLELTHLTGLRSNRDIHDIKSAANALGYTEIVEGVDCRMPHGMEAEFIRRGSARCAEILNARAKAAL